MNFPKLRRVALILFSVFIGVYLWLKIFEAIDPQDEGGEIDPDLPLAQPGDLLLFNHADGLNRMITWFTKSKYYHVGIYGGEGKVVEARPRGVVCRDLNGPDGDKHFDVIPAEAFATREAAQAALSWARAQIGDGYDPVNVLSIVLDRTFSCFSWNASLPRHWSCGEFAATAFEQVGATLFEKPAASVVPADFERFLPASKPRQRRRG
jgi:hypothetical protein